MHKRKTQAIFDFCVVQAYDVTKSLRAASIKARRILMHPSYMKLFITAKPGSETSTYGLPAVRPRRARWKFYCLAKPHAHETKVEAVDATHYIVSVTEPPIQGKANAAILRALAEHFHVPPSTLRILRGHASRQKIIEILSQILS